MSTALALQPERWGQKEIQLLKDTVCKGVTDEEFKLFSYAVKRTGLDPFMKQIHAVKRWDTKLNREVMSIQVGIDGYRLTADRSGLYAGNEEIVFDDEKHPTKATATVYKLVNGVRCAFKATARWSEYYPGDKMGFMWKKMPCVMLGKVAEGLALRMAFPAELSGIYTKEEMEQTNASAPHAQNSPRDVSNEVVASQGLPDAQNLNAGAGNRESGGVKFPNEVREEVLKIRALQKELDVSEQEFKQVLHEQYKVDSMMPLSIEQLKRLTHMLLEEKEIRSQQKAPMREPGSDDEVPAWQQETMGPML